MAHDKPKSPDPSEGIEAEKESKGQYGGLTSLGPGGGSDIQDATETSDVDRPEVEPKSKPLVASPSPVVPAGARPAK